MDQCGMTKWLSSETNPSIRHWTINTQWTKTISRNQVTLLQNVKSEWFMSTNKLPCVEILISLIKEGQGKPLGHFLFLEITSILEVCSK